VSPALTVCVNPTQVCVNPRKVCVNPTQVCVNATQALLAGDALLDAASRYMAEAMLAERVAAAAAAAGVHAEETDLKGRFAAMMPSMRSGGGGGGSGVGERERGRRRESARCGALASSAFAAAFCGLDGAPSRERQRQRCWALASPAFSAAVCPNLPYPYRFSP
jgi:hypothetical protein